MHDGMILKLETDDKNLGNVWQSSELFVSSRFSFTEWLKSFFWVGEEKEYFF